MIATTTSNKTAPADTRPINNDDWEKSADDESMALVEDDKAEEVREKFSVSVKLDERSLVWEDVERVDVIRG